MRTGKAKLPKTDTKADLERLWASLGKKPPGEIVGIRTMVAGNSSRKDEKPHK